MMIKKKKKKQQQKKVKDSYSMRMNSLSQFKRIRAEIDWKRDCTVYSERTFKGNRFSYWVSVENYSTCVCLSASVCLSVCMWVLCMTGPKIAHTTMCMGSVAIAVAVVQPPTVTCGPTQSNPTPTPKLSRNQPKSASDPRRGGESTTATTTKRMWVILNWCHFPLPFLVNCNKAARAGQEEVRGDSERHPVDEKYKGGTVWHCAFTSWWYSCCYCCCCCCLSITKSPKLTESQRKQPAKQQQQ